MVRVNGVFLNMCSTLFPCNFIIILCAVVLAGCSAGQPIRVLDRGATQLTASLGGPVVPSTSPVKFIPYATLGAMHGITEDVTIHGNLHLLMLAYKTFGVDVGASGQLFEQDHFVPELTVGLRTILFTDFSAIANVRVYPDACVTASWEVDPDWLVYAGSHATMQFNNARVFVSPMVGVQPRISSHVSLQLEVIWQAANVDTRSGLFRGESSVGGNGSLGLFLGIGYTL
jgi:hypothetical protein